MKRYGKNTIFYLVTRSEAGGVQSHILELIRGLNSKYALILASGEKGPLTDEAGKLGIDCYHIPELVRPISPRRDRAAYHKIKHLLGETRPDLLHTHSSKAGFLGRLAAWRLGIPSIFTAHGWAFTEGTPMRRKLLAIAPEMLMAMVTKKIINVSSADLELALKYRIGRPDKLVMIHNGIRDCADVKDYTHTKDSTNPVQLVMVARFSEQKRQVDLLRAVSKIGENFFLTLVGDGPELEICRELAAQLGMAEKIAFAGSRDDVTRVLAMSDIFLLASDWEGLPISILEAMRAGLPVIANDVGGVSELVVQGKNGILVDRGDVNGLSAAISELIGNPDLRKQFGNQGRYIYEQKFQSRHMLPKVDGLYQSLLNVK